jgi:Mg-chelatase subunit ChlD
MVSHRRRLAAAGARLPAARGWSRWPVPCRRAGAAVGVPLIAASARASISSRSPPRSLDGQGRLVSGLTADDFEVYEDGERQQLTQFALERVPVSVALLLDVSDSMFGRRIVEARAAVSRFLFDLLDQTTSSC